MSILKSLEVFRTDPFSYRVTLFTSFNHERPNLSVRKNLDGIEIEAWIETQGGDVVAQLDVNILDQTITEEQGSFLTACDDISEWPLAMLNLYFRQIVNGVRMPQTRKALQIQVVR